VGGAFFIHEAFHKAGRVVAVATPAARHQQEVRPVDSLLPLRSCGGRGNAGGEAPTRGSPRGLSPPPPLPKVGLHSSVFGYSLGYILAPKFDFPASVSDGLTGRPSEGWPSQGTPLGPWVFGALVGINRAHRATNGRRDGPPPPGPHPAHKQVAVSPPPSRSAPLPRYRGDAASPCPGGRWPGGGAVGPPEVSADRAGGP